MSKSFFGNPVLRDVSIALHPGRVHALLGENGAGKSTLINLLSGALQPDGGAIEIDGSRVSGFSPRAAQRAGIAVVQQELSLTSHLSIAENIGLGAMPRRMGFIDYRVLAERARHACAQVGLEESLDTPVAALSLGRRQMVEIARVLYRKARVVILDEPTSSLSAHEALTLNRLVMQLKAEGVAVLYISHRLNEVIALCDHVTVLKDGACTADQSLEGVDPQGLVRLMVGRDPGDLFPPSEARDEGKTALAVTGFSAGMVKDAAVTVRAGEIVGIGGLVGQGQEDLLLGLYGAIPARVQTAQVGTSQACPASVADANTAGLAYIPADRKREGLFLTHSIGFNLVLPSLDRLSRNGLRRPSAETATIAAMVRQFTIKGDIRRPVQALSGGNQQKVALAKWMPLDPAILLLNDPTRGVDIETKREIYLMLQDLARQGKAILLLSSDTPELVHLCDRVAVIREGRIVVTLERDDLSEESIVAAAMGVEQEAAAA